LGEEKDFRDVHPAKISQKRTLRGRRVADQKEKKTVIPEKGAPVMQKRKSTLKERDLILKP